MFSSATQTTQQVSQTAVAEQPDPVRLQRDKPVAVTGASGFVGTHLCQELTRHGWQVYALVRNPDKAAARLADVPVTLKVGDIRDPDFVRTAVQNAGAVVHLAAIAIERHGESYEQTNAEATRVMLEAAQQAGVDRFVHMSQNGSDSQSPFRFLRSKGIAQDVVTSSTLSWTVFRPSVIFGPEDEFVNVLARLIRLTPLVFPLPGGGSARFQPVYVGDVAAAIRIALENDETIQQIYPLGGLAPLTLRQMVERILLAMQERRTIVSLPIGLVRPLLAVAQRLLPNPPVTTSLLDLLAVDNTIPNNTITTIFGLEPTPFAPEELRYLQQITTGEAFRSLFGR
jgi:NADH dehydrogenase